MAWRPEDFPDFERPYDPFMHPGISEYDWRRYQRYYFVVYLPGLTANVEEIFKGMKVVWPDEEDQS